MKSASSGPAVYHHHYFYSDPGRGGGVLCRACLSVCLLFSSYFYQSSSSISPELHKFSVHITYSRGSVLLWRRCDMLCTSGSMDYVTFAHNGRRRHVETVAASDVIASSREGQRCRLRHIAGLHRVRETTAGAETNN